jgi:cytochrome P450
MSNEVDFNPLDPRIVADPFPFHKPLMQGPPKQIFMGQTTTLIAQYNHVSKVLKDFDNFKNEIPQDEVNAALDVFGGAKVIPFADEPDHGRLRKLVRRTFSPQSVRTYTQETQKIVDGLIEGLRKKKEFDFVTEFAYLIPLYVICWMMDMPLDHRNLYERWARGLSAIGGTEPGQDVPTMFSNAQSSWRKYFAEMVDKRLKEPPQEDFLGEMIDFYREGQMSYDDAVNMMMLVLLAGQDTTAGLLSNVGKNLLTHPDQLQLLRSQPDLVNNAVEETMRFDNSVLLITRYAKENINFEGTDIPGNSPLFVILAAANRDPARFPDPDRYDITRNTEEQLGLGIGLHFCLGAYLARMENQIALTSWLKAFPNIRLSDPDAPFKYRGGHRNRALTELMVRID